MQYCKLSLKNLILCLIIIVPTINKTQSLNVSETTTCKLPDNEDSLKVRNALSNKEISLGSEVPKDTPLLFACKTGYTLKGFNNTICGPGGRWIKKLPSCISFCTDEHPRSGFSTKAHFELNGIDVSHDRQFEPGTKAKISCTKSFNTPKYFENTLVCTENGWSGSKVPCEMECGKPVVPITKFSRGGFPANITEVPWHIGIYLEKDEEYENICGGVLISPRIVVSAAHCFFKNDSTVEMTNLTEFFVAAGKDYRDYNSKKEVNISNEKRRIIEIWIPEDYGGKERYLFGDFAILKLNEFIPFSDSVRPVCLLPSKELKRIDFSGLIGKLSTWGETTFQEPYSVLKTLLMGAVSLEECNETLSKQLNLNLPDDKFCLVSYDEAAVACKGDSGSGFVVKLPGTNEYVLFGIVSFSPIPTVDCVRHNLLVVTNVLYYHKILEQFKREDLEHDVDGLNKKLSETSERSKICRLPAHTDFMIIKNFITGELISAENNAPINTFYTITCENGYILSGSNVTYCGSNGHWIENFPKCIPFGPTHHFDEFLWPCDTGDQCIDKTYLCDGTLNCDDGSDETVKNCIQKTLNCNSLGFRCSYGVCIEKSLRCNGQKDCVDGSDELPALCQQFEWEKQLQGNCSNSEKQCHSGECISQDKFCDGQADCVDASDESLEVCSAHSCPFAYPTFRCGYGGCVKSDAICNGKADCFDASDESPMMCDTRVKPTCRIPATKRFLKIRAENSVDLVALGAYVERNTTLIFSCDAGRKLIGKGSTVWMGGNIWNEGLPDCYFYCSDKHPRSGFSTNAIFKFNGNIIQGSSFEPGTVASIKCAYSYETSENFRKNLTCTENGWSERKVACDMNCGRTAVQITAFSKGGIKVNISEAPWHVSIYNNYFGRYENICSGTLISPRVVVSAAHCFRDFWVTKTGNIEWSTFSVAAGKNNPDYDKEEFSVVEKRNIIDVWIHDEYKGYENGYYRDISIVKLDRFITFSDTIRPACLYLPEEALQYIQSDKLGQITAWHQFFLRNSEPFLEIVQSKTLSHSKCDEELLNKSLSLRGDKFCAAPVDENAFVCKGDSGSGFVARMPDGTFALFGILSFTPGKTQDCSRDKLLVMTNVLYYKTWLRDARDQDLANDIDFDALK